jgi:phage terminase large subunit-like protein
MLKERKKGAGSSFDRWVKEGYIIETPGARIDYDRIEQEILKAAEEYNIQQVAIDPWNAQQLSTRLETQHGLTVVAVRQGMFTLSAATKDFLDSITEKRFEHFNNPVLAWNASNLAIIEDATGNLMPSKLLSKKKKKNEKITGTKQTLKKIDGITAIINALTRVLVAPETKSLYESQDVRSF